MKKVKKSGIINLALAVQHCLSESVEMQPNVAASKDKAFGVATFT